MVIFYDKTTFEITRVAHNTIEPAFPAGMTLEQKRSYYDSINEGFVAIEGEVGTGVEVFSYKPSFDANGNFTGLQPK